MPDQEPVHGGRRSYDPSAELLEERMLNTFREEVAQTRHQLRNEFTAALVGLSNRFDALESKVEIAALQSTKEHAVVTAHLERLTEIQATMIDEIKGLVTRTTDLEKSDSSRSSVAADRRWLVGTALAVIGAMAAMLAFIPH